MRNITGHLYLSPLFHLLISISALPTNIFKSVVVVFEPIMLLWLVIMRLQGLIPVIVSLRSSESERRWCGFTPWGGKHGRGRKALTDGRSKALPDSAFRPAPGDDQSGRSIARPSRQISQSRRARGGNASNCCGSNVGPRNDREEGGEKRKSNSRKEKTHGGGTSSERRGTIFFC